MKRLLIMVVGFILILSTTLLAQKKKPNVLFIISDQHKQAFSGAYGHEIVKTPNIDALAKSGVTFTNAYTPAPVCAPTRAAIVTGMYPYANGAIYHKAPVMNKNGKEVRKEAGVLRATGYHEGLKTVGEIFQSAGYITAAPGKMHVHGELQKNVDPSYPEGNSLGWDETSVRYYTHFPGGHYEDEVGKDAYHRYRQILEYKSNGGSQDLNPQLKPSLVEDHEDNFDMVVAKKAIDFIKERGQDKNNFFLHVGFEKPHLPLTTLQEYYDMYDPESFTMPETAYDWYGKGKYPWIQDWVHNGWPKKDKASAKRIMAAYASCITEMDDMIGRIVTTLKENDLYDNTIIIYTTDHGEHMFEHGLRGKHNMYEAAVKVPFIISYPSELGQGTRNESIVSLIDVMPTITELINKKPSKTAQGVSLVATAKTGKELKDRVVFSEYRAGNYKAFPKQKDLPSRMMRKGNYKYIYTQGIIGQLYDVVKDPLERNNLVLDPEYKDLVNSLCFQTIADWRFQKYSEMDIKKKGKEISWEENGQAESYAVFYSKTLNSQEAELVASTIKETSYEVKNKGYYWVMAMPKLTRTTPHLGENIPVWTTEHSFQLPITNAIKIGGDKGKASK